MEIPSATLSLLSCAECGVVLSRGPVFQAHDGAALCGRCVRADRPTSRNQLYEAVAQLLRFPCKNRELGCTDTVPFTLDNEHVAHEDACPYRQYLCPVVPRGQCEWLGSSKLALLEHCETEHSDKVFENGTNLTPNIKTTNQDTYLLHVFYYLFLVHVKVCVPTGKIFYSVRYLGPVDKAQNYRFTVDIKSGEQSITKSYSVAPPGCLAIQEDSAMTLYINSLLQVLDGFDGAEFTLTVWNTEGCKKCGDKLKKFEFSDEDGWLCEKCRPGLKRRKCKHSDIGCTFSDFEDKCEKHEICFCPFTTKCLFCNNEDEIICYSLISHYYDDHKDVTHKSGSTWRNILQNGKACLISSDDIGLVRCRFWKEKQHIEIKIVTPLSTEELPNYYCEIKLTNHITKKSKTFKKHANCCDKIDWCFGIHRNDFVFYKGQFDICISINKVESE